MSSDFFRVHLLVARIFSRRERYNSVPFAQQVLPDISKGPMKITCPACGALVPVENIALESGWGKCSHCHDVFALAEVLEGYTPPQQAPSKPERPFDAWAVLERTPGKLMIHIPPPGMRAGYWALLVFAIFWLGFVAFWTAGALGLFSGGNPQLINIGFAAFSTPFWLVGFGLVGSVLWMSRGSRTVYLDESRLVTELRCLFWRRRRIIDRAEVQHARKETRPLKSESSHESYFPYAIEIIFEKGSFRLPCQSEAEQVWLLAEINEFLRTAPYRPSPFLDFAP
jgi:hypothetical protein